MNRPANFQAGPPFTKTVKMLMIITVAIWLVGQVILEGFILKSSLISGWLSLVPEQVIFGGRIWQLLTYMFLHSSQITHVLFNMLMLWFFGAPLEQRWGPKFFLTYYLVTGVGAAIIYVIGTAIAAAFFGVGMTAMMVPVQGASGAIFGLLLAYGLLFGEQVIYFMMIFPMKAKFFVMIMGCIEMISLVQTRDRGSEVAYLAHLGGIAAGFLFLKGYKVWERRRWAKKLSDKHKGRNLRLVVDNEKEDDKKNGPKYWN